MDPLPESGPLYWAPEVSYLNGVFYLYYASGNEEHMHLRVATSRSPAGPFIDSGKRLTAEKFAIDAHVFVDNDQTRYIFYAADFLDHARIGTGTVVDRMIDPFTLAGQPRPVTRAKYDWQIFDPHRDWKGGVCWHTLEGPFVLKRDGRYYQMFSGGNYQNDTYGVGYAVAGSMDDTGEWEQCCDGVENLPVLRTLPQQGVIGPGHNSVVRGPDNHTLYCIYHRFLPETGERVMAIDPLRWEEGKLMVEGPSVISQPIALPTKAGFDDFECESGGCRLTGQEMVLFPCEIAQVACPIPASDFVLEISLQMQDSQPNGSCGLSLRSESGLVLAIDLQIDEPAGPQICIDDGIRLRCFSLPEIDLQAVHLLRLEAQAGRIIFTLDSDIIHEGARLRWEGRIDWQPTRAELHGQNSGATFTGFAITNLV